MGRCRTYITNNYDAVEIYGYRRLRYRIDEESSDGVPIRKLLIANINQETIHKQLVEAFSKFGKIDDCILKKQKDGKKSYAFITYNKTYAAESAIEDGLRTKIRIDGQYLRVLPAVPWNQPDHPNNQIDLETYKPYDKDDYIHHDAPINELNNDCLMHIFSYLPVVERIKIERVCQRWRSVSLESWCLYRKLDLSESDWEKMDAPSLYRVLLRCGTYLHHIDLSTCSEFLGNATLIAIANLCPNIHSLNIANYKWSSSGLKAIAKNCRNINTLNIRANTEEQEQDLSILFSTLNKLKCVRINFSCSFMTAKCLLRLPIASVCKVVLELPNNSNKMQKHISEFLLMAKNLRSLRIDCKEDQYSLLRFMDVTQLCTSNLQVLSVSPSAIKLYPCIVALENIGRLKSLKELMLRICDCVDDDFLQKLSRTCKHLVKIDISGCHKVTDKGIGHLKSLMLQELYLNHMEGVTDEALSDFPSLKVLHCIDTHNIKNAGLIRLLEISSNINTIDVSFCEFISNELIDAAVESTLLTRNRILRIYVCGTSVSLYELEKSSPFLQVLDTQNNRYVSNNMHSPYHVPS